MNSNQMNQLKKNIWTPCYFQITIDLEELINGFTVCGNHFNIAVQATNVDDRNEIYLYKIQD